MRSVVAIMLLVSIARDEAEGQDAKPNADAHASADKLVAKLFVRAFQSWSPHCAEVDNTTIAKDKQLPSGVHQPSRFPWLTQTLGNTRSARFSSRRFAQANRDKTITSKSDSPQMHMTTEGGMSSTGNFSNGPAPRILSIQSTVSHGYVGNKCATFPLQCMGFNVNAINTVSLSNHPNYPQGFTGQFLSADELLNTLAGLEKNDLLHYDVIISGYVRSVEVLKAIKATVEKVQRKNPNAIYICDPVLGDNGKFYVPEELLNVYRSELIPLAHVVTPNYYEVEVLTGVQVATMEDAEQACAKLHKLGVKVVIMTGQRLSGPDGPQSIIYSSRLGKLQEQVLMRKDVDSKPGHYNGCGDLYTALCACGIFHSLRMSGGSMRFAENSAEHVFRMQRCLRHVLDCTASAMSDVVTATFEHGSKELRIIESLPVYRRLATECASFTAG